jgi:hypothetical protein
MPAEGKFSYTADKPAKGGHDRVICFWGPIARRTKSKSRPTAPSPLFGNTARFLREEEEDDLGLIGFENGHLIPLDLGGPNKSCNIVPMFSYFNQSSYRDIEKAIYNMAGVTDMKVTISYRDDLLAIPNQFAVQVKKNGSWAAYKTITMETETARPFPIPSGDNWTPIVTLIRTNLPKQKTDTPYDFLEPLRDTMGLGASQATTKFSTKERTIIMIANSLYDKADGGVGFLKSDEPHLDVFKTLVRMGGNNRPQVDHILPKSFSGSNSFENARLVSLKRNKSKLADVSQIQLQRVLANKRKQPERAAHSAKRQKL